MRENAPDLPLDSPSPPFVRFDVFEADLRAAELRKNGRRVKLQDQPFQLLAMLLERPGQVTTREQLRSRLWPVDTFVDFDHGLNAAIKRLRDALGDSAENPRFIETLARRGYRFIAPVHSAVALPSASVAPTPQSDSGSGEHAIPQIAPPRMAISRRVVHWRIVIAAALILAVGTGAGWVAARYFNPSVQSLERRLTANAPDDPILNAVISPDAKYLAFADRSGLFLRAVSTGETYAVPLPEGFKPQPAGWFRDNSHVLVTKASDANEGASLWSVSVLGGAPRKLLDNAEARAVSPDGSQIAFIRGDILHEAVWVMSADGERPRRVFGDPGDMFGPVAWSPNGRMLAFVRSNYASGYKDGQTSLWVVQPDGGPPNLILSDPRLAEALAWSPDGRLIYSLAEPPPNQGDSNLWAIHIDPVSGRAIGGSCRITSGPDRKVKLSLTADGKHLTFLRWRAEPDIFVADVDPNYERISTPQNLSLDEGRNLPFAWTSDGKSVLFTSDRDGPFHIFRQAVDQAVPDLLVGGPEPVRGARLSPDGNEILYLLAANSTDAAVSSLIRVPLSGGTPQVVLREPHLGNFQCARAPSRTCVFSRSVPPDLVFIAFDPVTGKEHNLVSAARSGTSTFNWTLSPDGSTIALAEWRRGKMPAEIQLVSAVNGSSRMLSLQDWSGISALDWAADGRSLWVSAVNPAATQALLNVDLRGHARPLLQDARRDVGWAIQSLDGRHIAFWKAGGSANAWLLEGF